MAVACRPATVSPARLTVRRFDEQSQNREVDSASMTPRELTEWFLPASLREDEEQSGQAILLSGTLVSLFSVAVISFLVFVFMIPAQHDDQVLRLGFTGIAAGASLAMLFVLRATAKLQLTANLYIFCLLFVVSGPAALTGGLESPAIWVLAIIPLIASLIVNPPYSTFWAMMVLLVYLGFHSAQISGYVFPSLGDATDIVRDTYTWIALWGIVVIVLRVHYGIARGLSRSLSRERSRFAYLAAHDVLTGLPNRMMFMERLLASALHIQREGKPFSIMYIDVDHFKPVNDRYGHAAGDMVLKEVARRLEGIYRRTDVVARIGGDEFAILLEDTTDPQFLREIAQKTLDSIAQPISIGDIQTQVSVSIGVARYSEEETDPEVLFCHADQLMYEAKNTGSGYRMSPVSDLERTPVGV